MYIDIKKRIFKTDPAKRFAKYHKCDENTWRNVWYKYKMLEYTKNEAKEYLTLLINTPVTHKKFNRWVERTEVYLKSQIAIQKGAITIHTDFFGKHKTFVEKELTKNNKSL